MITLDAESADAVWLRAIDRLRSDGEIQQGRDQPTKELIHVTCSIADPRQRLVFARPMNPAFAVAEVVWILAGANDAGFLRFWNPRMARFLDDGSPTFHGAYGHRLGSRPRLRREVARALRLKTGQRVNRRDQLRAAYETLRHEPSSRQVVLQIWDSDSDMPNPQPRSKDIPCNLVSHLLVRNGRLEWLQVMRSNDLIWGMPYNFLQFTTMQEIIAGWLGIDVGSYHHISDSLHIHQRHWVDLGGLSVQSGPVPKNHADLRIGPYQKWERLWAQLVECAMELAEHPEANRLLAVADGYSDMPPAYLEWVWLLTAEALRRRGHTAAYDIIDRAGPFWAESWRRWAVAAATTNAHEGHRPP